MKPSGVSNCDFNCRNCQNSLLSPNSSCNPIHLPASFSKWQHQDLVLPSTAFSTGIPYQMSTLGKYSTLPHCTWTTAWLLRLFAILLITSPSSMQGYTRPEALTEGVLDVMCDAARLRCWRVCVSSDGHHQPLAWPTRGYWMHARPWLHTSDTTEPGAFWVRGAWCCPHGVPLSAGSTWLLMIVLELSAHAFTLQCPAKHFTSMMFSWSSAAHVLTSRALRLACHVAIQTIYCYPNDLLTQTPLTHHLKAVICSACMQSKRYGFLAGVAFAQGLAISPLVSLALVVSPRCGGTCLGHTVYMCIERS